jgi:hypothetical protein
MSAAETFVTAVVPAAAVEGGDERSVPRIGGLLPFVALPLSEIEAAALNAYRVEYASYRMGAAKGAKGEISDAHQTDRYLVTLAMEKQYREIWATAAEAQESAEQPLLQPPRGVSGNEPEAVREVKPLVLVLGSSVSMGVGASSLQHSWAGQLEAALETKGVALRNEGCAGKETRYTLGRFQALPVRGSHGPSLVIVSLSLNNEGLKSLKGEKDLPIARFVATRFLEGLKAIASHAESRGSKVLLCSIYPSELIDPIFLPELQRVDSTMRSWQWPVADFWTPVRDADRHHAWAEGSKYDTAHPNGNASACRFDSL